MDRPTTSVTLPVSGFTCAIVSYYTKSEDDAINRYGMEGAEVVVEPDPTTGRDSFRFKNMPVDRFRREIAKLLEFGIVAAKRGDEVVPVGKAFVDDLPTKDIDTLSDLLIITRSGGNDDPKAPSSTSSPLPTS